MEEVTVYDEAIARMAVKLDLTVEEVDAIMDMYTEESKQIHIERRHFKRKVASATRTVVQ
jgi:hypothetical protein